MTLAGKRILVVEDEYMIASDLRRALTGCGATVVGPTAALADGMALIDDHPVDAAVLDLNLEGEWTYPLADRLAAAAVPYLFLTGYNRWSVPDRYAAAALIAKPYDLAAVIAALERLVAPGGKADAGTARLR